MTTAIIGGGEHLFCEHQITPLGQVVGRLVLYGTRSDIEANYGKLIYKSRSIKHFVAVRG